MDKTDIYREAEPQPSSEVQESAVDCTRNAQARHWRSVPPEQRLLMDRHEAAEMLGIPVSTFMRSVKAGILPAGWDSRRWRVADILRAKDRGDANRLERRPKRVPLRPGATHLYRHYDTAGRLLYVGISLSAIARLADHKQESHWFWSIARIEVTAYPTREAAMKAERLTIKRERPLHNIVHAK